MSEKSWEAQAVDEIVAAEKRIEEIERLISYYTHLIFDVSVFGEYPHYLEEKIDDLESELSDLQREYRG